MITYKQKLMSHSMGLSEEIEDATITAEKTKILRWKRRFKNLRNNNYLSTESEVFTAKSQTETLPFVLSQKLHEFSVEIDYF